MQQRTQQVIETHNSVMGLGREDENDWKKTMKNLFTCISQLDQATVKLIG